MKTKRTPRPPTRPTIPSRETEAQFIAGARPAIRTIIKDTIGRVDEAYCERVVQLVLEYRRKLDAAQRA